MRQGLRAWDADTHVNPAADVLDRYVDPDFRARLPELAPHRVASGKMIGGTPDTDQYRIGAVVMDIHNAEDIAAWIEDDLNLTVIDRQQGNKAMVADYNAFMDGLRNGTLKHTGCPELRSHVLHAIARRIRVEGADERGRGGERDAVA